MWILNTIQYFITGHNVAVFYMFIISNVRKKNYIYLVIICLKPSAQREESVIMLFIAPGHVQLPLSEVAAEKKFSCDICGAVYKHAPNLTAHKKIHLGETRCDQCNKVLSRKSNYHRHLMMVHGIVMQKAGWSLQKQ